MQTRLDEEREISKKLELHNKDHEDKYLEMKRNLEISHVSVKYQVEQILKLEIAS